MKKRIVALLLACLMVALPVISLAADLTEVTIMAPSERRADHPMSRVEEYTAYQAFAKILEEKGVKLAFDLVSPEQYDQTLDMRLTAQLDLPDIISMNWNYPDLSAVNQADAGSLINILEACEKYDEDGSIWAFIDKHVPEARGLTTAPDGGIYWFIYPFSDSMYHVVDGQAVEYENYKGAAKGVVNVNLDWLNKLGIEYKMFMTPEEFKDVLVAFREQDANGDGAKNEVLNFDITTFENGIASSFGLTSLGATMWYTDGVHCPWYAPGIKDYLRYMNDLYNAGVYDTKALSEGMIDQICAAGEASAFCAYAAWSSTYDFTVDKYLYAPIIIDDDAGENGFYLTNRDGNSAIYMKFGITNACDDVEAAIKVFDAVYTEEYADLSYFGTEKTYAIDEYGFKYRNYDTALLNDPEWLDLPMMYYLTMNALPAVRLGAGVLENATKMPAWDEYYAFCDYVYTNDLKADGRSWPQKLALPTAEEAETLTALETTLQTYSKELLTDMILGNKNIDDLDQYIEEMKALGLDEYLAVYQARYDRYVASQEK